jgi:hypothetical protein
MADHGISSQQERTDRFYVVGLKGYLAYGAYPPLFPVRTPASFRAPPLANCFWKQALLAPRDPSRSWRTLLITLDYS